MAVSTLPENSIDKLKMNPVLRADSLSDCFQLKCIAKVHDIYEETVEKYIEEDIPTLMASGTSGHNMETFQTYDRSKNDDVGDQKKYYSQPNSKYFLTIQIKPKYEEWKKLNDEAFCVGVRLSHSHWLTKNIKLL